MRKKMLSALLCTAVAAGMLAGCGGGQETGTKAAETKAESNAQGDAAAEKEIVTIKLSHNKDYVTIPEAVIEAGKRLNEKYAAEGKNIEVQFETDYQQIDWTDYHNNIVFSHKSGDAPDIFTCDADIAGYADAGVVMDVTDLMTDDFVDGAFNACMVDGKAYAIPMDMPFRVIYYNKDDLKAIGWTDEEVEALPEKIRNKEVLFEDFIDICQEVVEKGGAKYGLVHRPSAGHDFYDIINALGGVYYNDQNQLVFDSQGILKFFQFTYDNAQTRGITPDNLNQLGWDTINKMVGTGEAFAYYGPMFSATYVAQAAGRSTEEFAKQEAFVLFPAADASGQPFAVAAPQTIAISADTKYPEICKDIVREMVTGSSDMMARHAATIYTLSSVKKANEDPQITEHPLLSGVTYMTDYAVTPPAVEGQTTLRGYLFTEIVTLELGQTTPEESFENVKAQAELNIDGLVLK
ncbi:ABC transporter substrate-binding protein [Enterocloster lavalensis]|uniref:ABC transporter substrate-binding protein n=1 Tax=Enterocloster lavalensis TaxID=460384 RepID=UPI001D06BA89|nr:extracellular solute-binding protein [Enterocloster lavalensis]MBS5604278.1 extracellular solute-binding protein [Enterocloster asparagiformis]MCB6344193.1 extracellular solute-binding protein [Enterocloster lavalensis]